MLPFEMSENCLLKCLQKRTERTSRINQWSSNEEQTNMHSIIDTMTQNRRHFAVSFTTLLTTTVTLPKNFGGWRWKLPPQWCV